MNSFALPYQPFFTQFSPASCVFMTFEPWTVAAWAFDGTELWREPIGWSGDDRSQSAPRLVVTGIGHIWVSRDQELVRLDTPEVIEVGHPIAEFAVLPDGFLVALLEPTEKQTLSVARLDRSGSTVWKTRLDMPPDIRSLREDEYLTWDMRLVDDPIVASERLAVVGACDYHSGLGCRFGLNVETGAIAWRTRRGPWSYVTPIGDSWFLGAQGYGAFELHRLAEDGSRLDNWPTDGYVVALASGDVHVIEMENIEPSRMHAVALRPGGSVKRGAHLDGYYTSKPALTVDGEMVFWRNEKLQVVDVELNRRTLERVPSEDPDGDAPSRMHLGSDGTLAFTLESRLWVAQTDFRPMDVQAAQRAVKDEPA